MDSKEKESTVVWDWEKVSLIIYSMQKSIQMSPGSIPLELFQITFRLEEALGQIHWRDYTSHLGTPQGQMSDLIPLQYKWDTVMMLCFSFFIYLLLIYDMFPFWQTTMHDYPQGSVQALRCTISLS